MAGRALRLGDIAAVARQIGRGNGGFARAGGGKTEQGGGEQGADHGDSFGLTGV
jgi:hypothetical protein